MIDVGWRSLAARVRFRSDVIVVCALLRAPGFRIGVRNDGVVWVPDQAWNKKGGWLAGRVAFG